MGMLNDDPSKNSMTSDAPKSMVGNADGTTFNMGGDQKLDDFYVENPGAAQTEQLDPTVADQAEAVGYEAQTGTVDEAETSSGRLNKITSQDSPLMQRAGAFGARQAGSRGLLNTSIAAGAAQGEMVDRAAPLAIKDSELFGNQRIENQRATNRAEEMTTQRETDVNISNVSESNKAKLFDKEIEADIATKNTAALNSMVETVIGANANINQAAIGEIGANMRAVLSSDTQAYIANNQTATQYFNSTLDAIGSLYSNPNLSAEAISKASKSLLYTAGQVADFFAGMEGLDLIAPLETEDKTVTNAAQTPTKVEEPTVQHRRYRTWDNL